MRARLLLMLPVFVFASACNLLPDAYSGCDKPQPYQSAEDSPPLRVPAGAFAPDTRNALRIPAVTAPRLPAQEKRCLDHPPSYETRPAPG
jgi:uncharacterized lipoprotein